MKDLVIVGGGTGSLTGCPTRWLGTNHVRGLRIDEPIEIGGGHTTLIGCCVLSGVSVRPGGSLTMVGCAIKPPPKLSSQAVAAVRLGKSTQLTARNCVFSLRDGETVCSSGVVSCTSFNKIELSGCRFCRGCRSLMISHNSYLQDAGSQTGPESFVVEDCTSESDACHALSLHWSSGAFPTEFVFRKNRGLNALVFWIARNPTGQQITLDRNQWSEEALSATNRQISCGEGNRNVFRPCCTTCSIAGCTTCRALYAVEMRVTGAPDGMRTQALHGATVVAA